MAVTVLTEKQKKKVFEYFKEGYSKLVLADSFDVSTRTIGRVIDEQQKLLNEEHVATHSDVITPEIKVGDKVKVTRVVQKQDGWLNSWPPKMSDFVNDGVVYTVTDVKPTGVYLDQGDPYGFPSESLTEVVEYDLSAPAKTSLKDKVGQKATITEDYPWHADLKKGDVVEIVSYDEEAKEVRVRDEGCGIWCVSPEHLSFDEPFEFQGIAASVDVGDEVAPEEYNFVATRKSISITRISDGAIVSMDSGDERFSDTLLVIIGIQKESEDEQNDSLATLFAELDTKTKWQVYENKGIIVIPEENRVFYKEGDQEVDFNGRLVSRLIEAVKSVDTPALTGLINFAVKLKENPSNRAVNELYNFLEAANIDITPEGDVRCFKKVRNDFKDIYTGKFDNSIGSNPKVSRNQVDEDSDRTCSHGLHVCSFSYLSSYGSGGFNDRIILCDVHPKDFVAVPRDYNNAKARVCEYKVVGEYELPKSDYDELDTDDEDEEDGHW